MLIVVAQFLLGFLSPCATASAQDFSLPARQADFKTFVQDFKSNYAYLDGAEKPWLTWEARYAGPVQQADSKEAFDAVLASALGELHDFHAEVRSRLVDRWLPVPTFADVWAEFQPSGAIVNAVRRGSDAERAGIHVGDRITSVGSVPLEQAIAARLRPAVSQSSPQAREWALLSVLTGKSDEPRVVTLVTPAAHSYTVTLPVERHLDRAPGELSLQRLPGNIALIRFNNSLGEQKTVAAFDKAISEVRDTTGLILDLRDVPSGGDSSVALGIMGRFASETRPYQRHRIPNYGAVRRGAELGRVCRAKRPVHLHRAGCRAGQSLDRQYGGRHGRRLRCHAASRGRGDAHGPFGWSGVRRQAPEDRGRCRLRNGADLPR